MVNTDNSLLNEKYRPVVLDDYVGNPKLKSSIAKQLEQNGVGASSTMKPGPLVSSHRTNIVQKWNL